MADRVIFDLGLVRELGYYTGVVFEVYDPAVGFAIGGGGRYDDLLGRFGRPRPACGVGLDIHRVHVAQLEEERLAMSTSASSPSRFRAAPCSGRRSTCSTASAFDTAEIRANDRRLIFPDIGVITTRPSDVPTYVEHGAADIGITGKDVLLEQADREVYELLDLNYGLCRMIVAAHRRRRPARRAAAATRDRADRHQVPADRDRPLHEHRPRRRRSWR